MKSDKINYNISAIIGNGFDIKILKGLGVGNDKLPTFENFYDWLDKRHFDPNNLLFKEVEERRKNKEDSKSWTDLEDIIADSIEDAPTDDINGIIEAIEIIREQFTLFLNEIITPTDIINIAQKYEKNKLGKDTLAMFYQEITSKGDNERLQKFDEIWNQNHIHYHWHFFNLNYTTLLDNYFQFDLDPTPYSTSDNNFTIKTGENKFGTSEMWTPYVRLSTNFHHPHGLQDVPKSMLLGTAGEQLKDSTDSDKKVSKESGVWKYNKPYIGRLDEKYGQIINDTNLFIIFGASLGKSDRYWWSTIIDAVLSDKATELIIYWYNTDNATETDIIEKIYEFCSKTDTDKEKLRELFKTRTRVTLYSDEEGERLQYGFKENASSSQSV